jgi:hypothetical protein
LKSLRDQDMARIGFIYELTFQVSCTQPHFAPIRRLTILPSTTSVHPPVL